MLEEIRNDAKRLGRVIFDCETLGLEHDSALIGVSIGVLGRAIFVHGKDIGVIKDILEDPTITKIGHNIKFDMQKLEQAGYKVNGELFDTMIAAWFIDPGSKRVGLKYLAKEILGETMETYQQTLQKHGRIELVHQPNGKTKKVKVKAKTLLDIPVADLESYCNLDVVSTEKLYEHFKPIVDALPNKDLFYRIDSPMIRILSDIETEGIKLDTTKLKVLEDQIATQLVALITQINAELGNINIDSPKQLAKVLFEDMKIPVFKINKKSGVPSTDDETLAHLSKDHEICKKLMEYRGLNKLKNTYLTALPSKLKKDGRLHPVFNLHGTATGRLSCDSPNLQNIPKDGELGKLVRKCFVPEEGNVLIKADYSQMELRMLAHVSKDPFLLHALRSGEDLHTKTAKTIFAKDEITDDERGKAKAINFGIIYGMTPYGLSAQLGITLEDAREYLNKYFRLYPIVREWKWKAISRARDTSMIYNSLGRHRAMKDLSLSNLDRIALNTPIQGGCADLVKIAMLRLKEQLVGTKAKMILQVHDEILVECPKEDAERIAKIVKGTMESVSIVLMGNIKHISLCPFIADVSVLDSWDTSE